MAKQNRELKRNMPLSEWLSRNTKEELVQMADLMGLGVPDSDSAPINTEKFVLAETPAVFDENIDVNTNFSFGVNATSQLVRCVMDYTYVYKGKEILNMVLSCVFKIEEEAFGNMLQDSKFILEPFFSRYLATINVGAHEVKSLKA